MELIIRSAVMADLDRCAAIESACFPPTQAASRQSIRRRIETYPNHILLGEVDGLVVGFAMGPVIAQPTIVDEMFADPGCHSADHPYQSVFSLAVHPDWQRRGVGRALARFALERMTAETKDVEVLFGNEPARNLYRSLGFTKETLVHGRMPGNEDFRVTVWQMVME